MGSFTLDIITLHAGILSSPSDLFLYTASYFIRCEESDDWKLTLKINEEQVRTGIHEQ